MGQEETKDNIWDRIFKTLFLKMPEMFLPLINEVFEEGYDRTAKILLMNNEFYNADGSKVVSDTAFLVNDMLYHFECQFSNDKEMAFRMFEYDFQIGLSDSKSRKCINEFNFPRSCVVYITTNRNNPKELNMKVNFPDGSYIYRVPTVRVHDYSLDSINQKKLLIFLPYLVLRYPQKLKNKKPTTKEEIVQFYREMLELLEFAYNDSVITVEEYNVILEAIKEAEQRIFKDYADIKQEVDGMVSDTLELKSIKMRDEAVKEAVKTLELESIKMRDEAVKEAVRTLELKSIRMRDEAVKEAVKTLELESIKMRDEAVKQAVRKATLDNIETFKQLGVKFSDEQMKELLKRMP
ncbi:MAG: hypothetical protein NC307_11980 [Roseburia sp.]|nr:hypothetical protein [Roseburia sp.]